MSDPIEAASPAATAKAVSTPRKLLLTLLKAKRRQTGPALLALKWSSAARKLLDTALETVTDTLLERVRTNKRPNPRLQISRHQVTARDIRIACANLAVLPPARALQVNKAYTDNSYRYIRVSSVAHRCKAIFPLTRVSKPAILYLTTVLDSWTHSLGKCASKVAQHSGKRCVTFRHLQVVIGGTPTLTALTKNTLARAFVMPLTAPVNRHVTVAIRRHEQKCRFLSRSKTTEVSPLDVQTQDRLGPMNDARTHRLTNVALAMHTQPTGPSMLFLEPQPKPVALSPPVALPEVILATVPVSKKRKSLPAPVPTVVTISPEVVDSTPIKKKKKAKKSVEALID